MEETLIPAWNKERKAAEDLKAARESADRERQLRVAERIRHDGPDFWKQLQVEFARQTDSLYELNLHGKTVSLPSFSSTESAFRVSVLRPTNFPSQTYADFFYSGGYEIRCSILNSGMHNLRMCIWEDEIRVIWERRETIPLTAEELAEKITKEMVEFVEKS